MVDPAGSKPPMTEHQRLIADAPKEGWVYPTSRLVAAEDEFGMMWTIPRHEGEEVRYVLGTVADEYKRQRDQLLEAAKLAKQMMDNVPLSDRDGIDDNHPAMRQLNAAIAECEKES